MAVFVGLVLLLSCRAVHTFRKDCYETVGKCQTRFHQKLRNEAVSNDTCPYYDALLTCLAETRSMSGRCKATALKKTKASCLDMRYNCDKDMCSKSDGFIAMYAHRRTEEEACHGYEGCERGASQAKAAASSRRKCSMYEEDYKCYDAIPKSCNFSKKVTTQKNNCISKCKSVNVSVNEYCEMKDVHQAVSPISNLPVATTTISSVVNGSQVTGMETTTAGQSGTADDDDNAGRLSGNITDTDNDIGTPSPHSGESNDIGTPSPHSGESKSDAGLMWAPVGVRGVLLAWALGRLL